jgi:hypothetical protein
VSACNFNTATLGMIINHFSNTRCNMFVYKVCTIITLEFSLKLSAQKKITSLYPYCDFGGLVVSMLASGTQVRGLKPGRSRRIFRAKNILSMPSFGGEVKPSVPCRGFAACKRSLNGVENASFRQNYRTPFSPTGPPFVTRSARVVGDVETTGGESGNV